MTLSRRSWIALLSTFASVSCAVNLATFVGCARKPICCIRSIWNKWKSVPIACRVITGRASNRLNNVRVVNANENAFNRRQSESRLQPAEPNFVPYDFLLFWATVCSVRSRLLLAYFILCLNFFFFFSLSFILIIL